MKAYLTILILAFFAASCATKGPQAPDTKADTQLGLVDEERTGEAESTVEELHEQQRTEQRRVIERQATEIVTENA